MGVKQICGLIPNFYCHYLNKSCAIQLILVSFLFYPVVRHKYLLHRICLAANRLAYKSSSKSAKRCLVPCSEARSAIVRARASERVARASETSTCFPCWKSNQVTLFWRELFRVRSRRKGVNNYLSGVFG